MGVEQHKYVIKIIKRLWCHYGRHHLIRRALNNVYNTVYDIEYELTQLTQLGHAAGILVQ